MKYRARTHFILLYPDNEEHLQALDLIQKSYDYAGIIHDNDIDENGKKKKKHIHIVLRTSNATWNTAIAKELNLELRFIEQIKNLDNSLLYLLHYNDKDKAQYEVDDVFGNLKTRLNQALNNNEKTEGEKVTELITYIKNYDGELTITDFALYCASNGYWAEFRRSGAIICKIIDEKNRYNR